MQYAVSQRSQVRKHIIAVFIKSDKKKHDDEDGAPVMAITLIILYYSFKEEQSGAVICIEIETGRDE